MKKLYLLFICLFMVFSMLPALNTEQNNALYFDGINDYVSLPANQALNFTGLSTVSVSAWVNPSSGNAPIFNKTALSDHNLGISFCISSNKVYLGFDDHNFSGWQSITSSALVPNNQWTHVAFTLKFGMANIYINGEFDSSLSFNPNHLTATASTASVTLGGKGEPIAYGAQQLDELTIWTKELNSSDISACKQITLNGNETDLLAYYKFNQGIAASNNSTVSTLTNISPLTTALNGTLNNFALNGTSSNWVSGIELTKHLSASALTATLTFANSNSTSIEVSSNTSWTAASNRSWLTVSPSTSTTGNALLTLSATAIAAGEVDRSATITLTATGVDAVVITVTQTNPIELSISTNAIMLSSANSNTSTIGINSNLSWTAESDQEWLSVSPAIATTGNATLTVSATENTNNETRLAIVTITTSELDPETIIVFQAVKSKEKNVLYDNGPFINQTGGGFNNADLSILNGNNYGYSIIKNINTIADDFTNSGCKWHIDSIATFGYQTGSTISSTFTGGYYRIWNGAPNNGGTVVFGDLNTNKLIKTSWTGTYRTSKKALTDSNRPIMRNVFNVNTVVNSGTYWLEYQMDGSGTSGPWATPIEMPIEMITGNALQYSNAMWTNIKDGVSLNQKGFPFIIYGKEVAPINTVTQLGGTLTANLAGVQYQWINSESNTAITDATDQSYTPTQNGSYAVIITEGACSVVSNTISFIITDLKNEQICNASVFPNPTSDLLNLSSKEGVQNVSITNIVSNTVWNGSIAEFPINVSSFAKGIYLVNIVSKQGIKTEKVIFK